VRIVTYVKARLEERSTWVGIGAAIVGGSALSTPFSWLVIAAGVVAVFVPTKAPA
jgi:hypothetical protein